MEKPSIVDLKEICGRAWDVPACEVALLLNPQSTEVVHTRGTSVRLLVSQRHDVLCGPNPARLIVEGALKELEESVPLRRGAAEDLRRQLAAQQHRVADGIAQRDRLRAMLGLPAVGADGHEANAAPSEAPRTTAGSDLTGRRVVMDLAEVQRVVAEAVDAERKDIALTIGSFAGMSPQPERKTLEGVAEMVRRRVGHPADSDLDERGACRCGCMPDREEPVWFNARAMMGVAPW